MSITVHCTHCGTAFPVDPAKIPEGGVRVRCTECRGIFRVEEPLPAEPSPPVDLDADTGWELDAGTEPVVQDLPDPQPAPAPEEVFDSLPEPAPEPVSEGAFDPEPAPEEGFGSQLEPAPEPELTEPDPGEDGAASTGAEDWLIETEEPFDPDALEVEPMDTVEGQIRTFQEESWDAPGEEGVGQPVPGREEETFAGYTPSEALPETDEQESELAEEEVPPEATDGVEDAAAATEPEEPVGELSAPVEEPAAAPDPATPAPDAGSLSAPRGFQFGKRDPRERAKRLARVLVSDMVTYNPERHRRALDRETLREDFEEEIRKSWDEYMEQVGDEIATTTDYWAEALNEILARGEKLF